jgi:hypothetical protein
VDECTDDYGTPVLCDDSLKDFRGDVSDLAPLSSCLYSERNSGFSVASSLTRKLLFEIRSLVDVFFNWKELQPKETVF